MINKEIQIALYKASIQIKKKRYLAIAEVYVLETSRNFIVLKQSWQIIYVGIFTFYDKNFKVLNHRNNIELYDWPK